MDNSELFVLAGDLRFIPVHEIHEKAKSSFEHEENDMVLTHMHTRKSSKVLDPQAAGLLKEFETPKTLAEAIFDFSIASKKDPQQVADAAFELLIEMKEEEFLVSYKDGQQKSVKSFFNVNDSFRQYLVKEKLQLFDDSEVYRVCDKEGNKYALKLLKTGNDKRLWGMFENEISVLRKLDGKVNPPLIENGEEAEFSYVITEWCDMDNVEIHAQKIRNLSIRDNLISMMDLCIAILSAYDCLHKQGILHADIYPKNILISEAGACKIIDYGISIIKGTDKISHRGGGMCFYFEPEYAAAILQDAEPPLPDERAEQYSLATVLYYLIAGSHYLNFSIEREKLFKQILHDEPLSFNSFDLNLPAELDEIFAIALSKDPARRYPSLTDFANALIRVRKNIYKSHDFFISGKENAATRFVEFIIRKFGWDSLFLQKGLSLSPRSSVNYGAAGIAYMYYRMACIREEPGLLDLADVWANRAAASISDPDRGFYSAEMELTEKSIGNRSLYHSPTGVHLVQALISQCRGDASAVSIAINQFLEAAKKPCDQIDLALGRSGLLVACGLLINEITTMDASHLKSIISFANSLTGELWAELEQYRDITQPNPLKHYGIAHGWAGVLYATLFWCHFSKQSLPDSFIERVINLQICSIKNKESICWPLSDTDKHSWTGWCNGSAGYVFLWSLLYRHFREEEYISAASQAANHIIGYTGNNISNLCCGFAGEAYAMLNLFNLTKEDKYLRAAQNIRQKIIGQIELPPLRSNSLYKGDIGLALLFCEMEKPVAAKMPLFE